MVRAWVVIVMGLNSLQSPAPAAELAPPVRLEADGQPIDTETGHAAPFIIDFDGDGTTDFEFSDRAFNVRSLRLNAVLRWEYRPGSTLFLVWQQNRRERLDDGSFDLGNDFGALRSIEPDNIFIVKVNYWLGL